MLLLFQGVGYLLQPPPAPSIAVTPPQQQAEEEGSGSSSSSSALNISKVNKGKGRAIVSDDDEITIERWNNENEQVVSTLYFTVAPLYQPLVFNLVPKTVTKLFNTFEGMFVSKDTMVLVARRTELDNYKFKIDTKFLDQIMKFDEMHMHYKELRGDMSDSDLTFLLIKALPLAYKEKLSTRVSLQTMKQSRLSWLVSLQGNWHGICFQRRKLNKRHQLQPHKTKHWLEISKEMVRERSGKEKAKVESQKRRKLESLDQERTASTATKEDTKLWSVLSL